MPDEHAVVDGGPFSDPDKSKELVEGQVTDTESTGRDGKSRC